MAHPPTSFATLQRIFLAVGAVGLVVSVAMTFKFGYSMSLLHAIALCTVTIAAAFIFPAKAYIERAGNRSAARVVMALGCFFVGLEFFSHLGYTIGMRERSTSEADVQTVAYRARQDQLASNKTNLAMWREQLASLKAANAWAASVSADGLRASLDSATKAIELEEQRGGCKAKCLGLMKTKADLENRIAVAEQVTDLTKRIEATQRIIDKNTEVAVETKKGFSPVRAQTDFVGQLWLVTTGTEAEKALTPDSVTLTFTDIFIGFFLALGATLLPTAMFYLGFYGHKADEEVRSATQVAAPLVPAVSTHTNTVLVEVSEEAKRVEARLLAEMKARDAERKAREDAERAHAKEWQTRWGQTLQLKSA
jgi:hypothetical protein